MGARRVCAAGAVGAFGILLVPGTTGAQEGPPSVTVGADEVEIVTGQDGTSSLSVTLTVSGVDERTVVSVVVDGADPTRCVPLEQPILPPGVQTDVTFNLPATCELSESATVEFVTVPFDASSGTPSGVRVEATVRQDKTATPAYGNVGRGFGAGVLVALMAVAVSWLLGADLKGAGKPGSWSWHPWEVLKGLDTAWTWSDSPLSSVTVAAAVFTAVLGASDPLTTIVGEPGTNQVAVVIVAAALAAALTAAAPLALNLLRDEPPTYTGPTIPNNYTVLGVLVATVTVVGGNLGLIATVGLTLWDSSAIDKSVLITAALAAGALVVAYSVRSMRRTLKVGNLNSQPIEGTAGVP